MGGALDLVRQSIRATINAVITDITGFAGVAGRKTMANSFPVVISSEQMPDDSAAFTPSSDPYMPVGGEFDDAAPAGLAEGQGGAFRVAGHRALHVEIRDAAGNERGLNVDEDGVLRVGSWSAAIIQTPTVTAGIYAANDNVGGLLTFANAARFAAGGGILKEVIIVDDASQSAGLELWLFTQTFTAGADNAPWTPVEAELHNLVTIVTTNDGLYYTGGATGTVCVIEVARQFNVAGTSLFGRLVTRGTPTYAATDDVSVIVKLMQD